MQSTSNRRAATVLTVLVGVVICRMVCCDGATPQSKLSDASDDDAPYQSEVYESIGAAVAILVDTSGSMDEVVPGDGRTKSEVAGQALREMLATTNEFVEKRPDFPIKVTIFGFASSPWPVLPIQNFDPTAVNAALSQLPGPGGGTAIGEAMLAARPALYRSGVFRKYLLVITDGENTSGRDPAPVAREIFRKSEGVVQPYFVAFDLDPSVFGFLKDVGGEVVAADNGAELRAALKEIYEGKILAEAVDYGETPLPSDQHQPGSSK